VPDALTARLLLRHAKPLKLPERLTAEPADTAIFADPEMRDALTRRAEGLAGRLLPLESLSAGGDFDASRAVICSLRDTEPVLAGLAEDRPSLPARSLTCLPRSGSTYFCHLLQGLKTVAHPTEHLRPHILYLAAHGHELGFDPVRWTRLVARTDSSDGLFGSKVITDFAKELWPLLDGNQRSELASLAGQAKVIHLERTDKIAQSVSQFIAEETRIWHVRQQGDDSAYRDAKQAVHYDGERLRTIHAGFTAAERDLRGWLEAHDGPVHHVTYEALLDDPERVVSEAVAFIRDEPAEPVGLTHEKYFPMSDDINQAFAEKFAADLERERRG
jgi:LPS sulfotransferase NodH